jgi:hypothetical protein
MSNLTNEDFDPDFEGAGKMGPLKWDHYYRASIKVDDVVEGRVVLKNTSLTLTLKNITILVDVDELTPNWDCRICKENGAFDKAKRQPVTTTLGPGEEVTYPYFYRARAVGDKVVPDEFDVLIHIMPGFTLDFSERNRASATTFLQTGSATLDKDDPAAPAAGLKKEDYVSITSFTYSKTLSQKEAVPRTIRGTMTLKNELQLTIKLKGAISPSDNSAYFDAVNCDENGQPTDNSDPYWPKEQAVLPGQQISVNWQYRLEKTDTDPLPDVLPEFKVVLAVFPNFTVVLPPTSPKTGTAKATSA